MNYLALGDSISIDDYTGVPNGGAVSQFARLIGASELQDLTRDGRTTDGVLESLSEVTVRPDVVTLTVGGNDFLQNAYRLLNPVGGPSGTWDDVARLPLENLTRIADRLSAFGCWSSSTPSTTRRTATMLWLRLMGGGRGPPTTPSTTASETSAGGTASCCRTSKNCSTAMGPPATPGSSARSSRTTPGPPPSHATGTNSTQQRSRIRWTKYAISEDAIAAMQSPAFELAEEPQGEVYEALLRYARRHCDQFSLVWQHQLRFGPNADQYKALLEAHLISEIRTRSWPGTEAHQEALVRYYWLNRESATLLTKVNRLYAWLSPDLPEDLAFYSADGDCWLAAVSHERLGLFYERASFDGLQQNVPGIVLRR